MQAEPHHTGIFLRSNYSSIYFLPSTHHRKFVQKAVPSCLNEAWKGAAVAIKVDYSAILDIRDELDILHACS